MKEITDTELIFKAKFYVFCSRRCIYNFQEALPVLIGRNSGLTI